MSFVSRFIGGAAAILAAVVVVFSLPATARAQEGKAGALLEAIRKSRIEGIEQIAAIALPDSKRGHTLSIALRGDPDLVRRQAADLPKIRQVIALETWPVLASGKTDYPAIEALFADTDL